MKSKRLNFTYGAPFQTTNFPQNPIEYYVCKHQYDQWELRTTTHDELILGNVDLRGRRGRGEGIFAVGGVFGPEKNFVTCTVV